MKDFQVSGYPLPKVEDRSEEFPTQPVVLDGAVHRFRENRIINELVTQARKAGYTLNHIAADAIDGKFTRQEQRQFNQLIGYSVSGYNGLSFVMGDEDEEESTLPEVVETTKTHKCSVCGTTEGVSWVGGSIPYLCGDPGCTPF